MTSSQPLIRVYLRSSKFTTALFVDASSDVVLMWFFSYVTLKSESWNGETLHQDFISTKLLLVQRHQRKKTAIYSNRIVERRYAGLWRECYLVTTLVIGSMEHALYLSILITVMLDIDIEQSNTNSSQNYLIDVIL